MRIRQCLASFVTNFSVFTLLFTVSHLNRLFADVRMMVTQENIEKHRDIVDKYFSTRNTWVTSNVGAYLFNTRTPRSYVVKKAPERGYYSIFLWDDWDDWLINRHVYGYSKYRHTPLLGCSVSNCEFEKNNHTFLATADAVVVHLATGRLPDIRERQSRKPFQRWIFWTDESPRRTFFRAMGKIPSSTQLAGIFNWSMMYRMVPLFSKLQLDDGNHEELRELLKYFRSDADVPIPYGRTIPLPFPKLNNMTYEGLKELVPYWKKKRTDILAVNIMSRCQSFRLRFIKQLRRYMSVDMFGRCAETKIDRERCPGHYEQDCPVISEYLFYLVIENSNCRQYISEKIFHHAYSKGAIPIILGAPLEDCIKLLPPNSFLHMENFVSVKDLVKAIEAISDDLERLLSYHAWRNNFETVEEHGFLGTWSMAMCRLCEAMNYNDRSIKVYGVDDIRLYLDPVLTCSENRNWL